MKEKKNAMQVSPSASAKVEHNRRESVGSNGRWRLRQRACLGLQRGQALVVGGALWRLIHVCRLYHHLVRAALVNLFDQRQGQLSSFA